MGRHDRPKVVKKVKISHFHCSEKMTRRGKRIIYTKMKIVPFLRDILEINV